MKKKTVPKRIYKDEIIAVRYLTYLKCKYFVRSCTICYSHNDKNFCKKCNGITDKLVTPIK